MSSNLLITRAGLSALINAEANGTLPITISHIGFGSGKYEPTGDETALSEPLKNFTALKGNAASETMMHIVVEDVSNDMYSVHEVGVFLTDGTLFAICSQQEAILQKAPYSQVLLALDIAFSDFSAASVVVGDTTFVNPPATTEMRGVVELASEDETIEGVDDERAVTPAALKAFTDIEKNARTEADEELKQSIAVVEDALLSESAERKAVDEVLTQQLEDMSNAFADLGESVSELLAGSTQSLGETGWQVLPGGTVLQWGKALVANGEAGTTIRFPVTFPEKCASVHPVSIAGVPLSFWCDSTGPEGVTLKHNGNGGALTAWFAVGY